MTFRILGSTEEERIVPVWSPGGAGRATVDMRRFDRKDETAIGAGVAFECCPPVPVGRWPGDPQARRVP